ncbi:MAG TPA: CHAT domain-containing protein, partial [Polyangiaceae bacterium]|nr:CHAT domain-containing protein [Polyangiaceae bacterium]
MNYLDFTLRLTLSAGATCRVSVLSSRGEEGEQDICLPFDPAELAALRASLHREALRHALAPRDAGGHHDGAAGRRDMTVGGAPAVNVDDVGKKLYEAVFQGPVAALFATNVEYARRAKHGLRIKLVTHDAALALIPWELLCTRQGQHVALSKQTPVARHVLVDKPQKSLRVAPPLRVLGILSHGGGATLDLDRERAQIDAELAPLVRDSLAEVEWLENPTKQGLLEALDRREWHIVHFAGHGSFDVGSSQGVLAMASGGGGRAHLRANDLRVMLRDRPSVRMVFLNSCDGAVGDAHELFSSTAAIVAEAGVPVVLAMQFPIADDVATAFARCVYRRLAAGDSVEGAVTAARKEIIVCHENPLEWATPVLFTRSAAGAIVQPAPRPSRADHRTKSGHAAARSAGASPRPAGALAPSAGASPRPAEALAPIAGPSPSVEGTLVPITRDRPEPPPGPRGEEALAAPPFAPLPRLQRPPVAAALALALVVMGLLVADGGRRFFEPPPAARPADVLASSALALPAAAPPGSVSAAAPPDWSNPCSLAAGAADWVANVRAALCDLEGQRPAAAWRKLDELARAGDLADDARSLVRQHASRAAQASGKLLARTSEPPAALTLSL